MFETCYSLKLSDVALEKHKHTHTHRKGEWLERAYVQEAWSKLPKNFAGLKSVGGGGGGGVNEDEKGDGEGEGEEKEKKKRKVLVAST